MATTLQDAWLISKNAYNVDTSENPNGFTKVKTISLGGFKADVYTNGQGNPVVSFRGSSNVEEWMNNMNVLGTSYKGGQVHSGFKTAYETLNSVLEPYIKETYGVNAPIEFTGHSLGGAIATLALADYKSQGMDSSAITFGAPAVGDAAFNHSLNGSDLVRITAKGDGVPVILSMLADDGRGQLPFYVQPGSAVHIEKDTMSRDEDAARAITQYTRAGINIALASEDPDISQLTRGEEYAEMLLFTSKYHTAEAYDEIMDKIPEKHLDAHNAEAYAIAEREAHQWNQKNTPEGHLKEAIRIIPKAGVLVRHVDNLKLSWEGGGLYGQVGNQMGSKMGRIGSVLDSLFMCKEIYQDLKGIGKSILATGKLFVDGVRAIQGKTKKRKRTEDYYSGPSLSSPTIEVYGQPFHFDAAQGSYVDGAGIPLGAYYVKYNQDTDSNVVVLPRTVHTDTTKKSTTFDMLDTVELDGKVYYNVLYSEYYVSESDGKIAINMDQVYVWNVNTQLWQNPHTGAVFQHDAPEGFQVPTLTALEAATEPHYVYSIPPVVNEPDQTDDILDPTKYNAPYSMQSVRSDSMYLAATGHALVCFPAEKDASLSRRLTSTASTHALPHYYNEEAQSVSMLYYNANIKATPSTTYGSWTLGVPDFSAPPLEGSILDSYSFAWRCDVNPNRSKEENLIANARYVCRIVKALDMGTINNARDPLEFSAAQVIVRTFMQTRGTALPLTNSATMSMGDAPIDVQHIVASSAYNGETLPFLLSPQQEQFLQRLVESNSGDVLSSLSAAVEMMKNTDGFAKVEVAMKFLEAFGMTKDGSYSYLKKAARDVMDAVSMANDLEQHLLRIAGGPLNVFPGSYITNVAAAKEAPYAREEHIINMITAEILQQMVAPKAV